MKRRVFLTSSLPLLACARVAEAAAPPAAPTAASEGPPLREREEPGGRELFAAAKVDGVFVLRALGSGEQIVTDAGLAGERELPASTFKIPCALIALDRKVAEGPDMRLPWDGEKRWIPTWNRDHTLATAIRDSAVWYFQELARRIGAEAFARALPALRYGSAAIGPTVDRFWLDGSLTISPREQVELMAGLRARSLPVSRQACAQVEHLITRAQQVGWSWRGKTGLGERAGRAVGWMVGLVERDANAWAYALMVRAPEADLERLIPLRPRLTRDLLVRAGALPAEA